MKLYPLKFTPISQYRIWGGNKLNQAVSEESQIEKTGEIWSISGIPGKISIVQNGTLTGRKLSELIEEYKERLVGTRVYQKFGNDFPLLIKFIDAADKLSVQVHPGDRQAKDLHGSFGKSEMWYIMESAPDSNLVIGFKEGVDKATYQQHLENNSIEEILNNVPVKEGDALYIPAGRVHAIGAGIVLAEIQQTSDITYRIYDYKRLDKDGNQRELHIENALSAIDFNSPEHIKTPYTKTENQFNQLIDSPYFETKIFKGNQPTEIRNNQKMRIYLCTGGKVNFTTAGDTYDLTVYQSLIIPAELNNFNIEPKEEATLLEVCIP